MAKKKTKNQVPAKKSNNLPAVTFESDSGRGFEGADKESFAIPFLSIIQGLSPQLKKNKTEYIKDAAEGDIFNNVTQELFDKCEVIPVYYDRKFIEWIPRKQGGGLVQIYDCAEGKALVAEAEIIDFVPYLSNGHEIRDTRMHYVVLLPNFEYCVIPMQSTQLKKSRKWMSIMSNIKFTGTKGKYTPPMYANVFELTTGEESNEKGDWYGWVINRLRVVNSEEYAAAKDFYKMIGSGAVQADFEKIQSEEDEDVMF